MRHAPHIMAVSSVQSEEQVCSLLLSEEGWASAGTDELRLVAFKP